MSQEKVKTLDIDTKEGIVEEREAQPLEQAVAEPKRFSIQKMLALLATAVAAGDLNSRDAHTMRARLGIHQSYFTRKKSTDKQKKAKRKVQKLARGANRGKTKGIKCDKGKKFRLAA